MKVLNIRELRVEGGMVVVGKRKPIMRCPRLVGKQFRAGLHAGHLTAGRLDETRP